MRGGLDDALDKLARRDELRRRSAGESPGTPPAVTELAEAIAGVISRHPNLNVTVGVEGAGDPTLLHFAFADGVVQVNAEHPVTAQAAPRHADFEIEVEEPVDEPLTPVFQSPEPPPRASRDDQDRFGPTDFDYAEPPTAERPYVTRAANGYRRDEFVTPPQGQPVYGHTEPASGPVPGQTNGAHPLAATPPPPVPPQTPSPYAAAPPAFAPAPPPPGFTEGPSPAPSHQAPSHQAPSHPAPPADPFTVSRPEPFVAPQSSHPPQPDPFTATRPEPFTATRPEPFAAPQPGGFPEPLDQPIPLQVERPEETEMAARRLAAMLRDNPTLLDNPPA